MTKGNEIRSWCWIVGLLLFFGCSPRPETSPETVTLRVWCHQGQESENQAMRQIAQAFNTAHKHKGIQVDVDFFPDYQYTEKVSIAAAGGDLPDVFDLDGPTVAQFAKAGLLSPLTPYFSAEVLEDFAPTILEQGTIDQTLYALGAFDSAMVLYYRKDIFEELNISPPPEGTAWSWETFLRACTQIATTEMTPVSLHMDITADEWFTYAFSPLIWSAGGNLISEDGRETIDVLNSPTNVRVLTQWRTLFDQNFARRSPINPDPFGSGESVMDWTGHWMAQSHFDTYGERLGVMPLPRTGPEIAAASGSWCWAISSHTDHPEKAAVWLNWVLDPRQGVTPMVEANGALPARKTAYQFFPKFDHSPFSTFRMLQQNHGRSRPRTPHYPVLTRAFAAALRDIVGGAEVQERLDQAAIEVQRVLDRSGRTQ